MELLLALVVGTLYASGIYLLLKRRLAQIIVGLSMLANASNLLIFTSAGLTRDNAPIVVARAADAQAPTLPVTPAVGTQPVMPPEQPPVSVAENNPDAFTERPAPPPEQRFADPVPQSLVLTAIVIGFGVLAFSLVLAHRVHLSAGTDDVDSITARGA